MAGEVGQHLNPISIFGELRFVLVHVGSGIDIDLLSSRVGNSTTIIEYFGKPPIFISELPKRDVDAQWVW